MAYLIDTSIIVRGSEPKSPLHGVAVSAVANLRAENAPLHLARQNLIEYRNVATRPIDKNGLGMTVAKADARLTVLEHDFDVLPDTDAIYFVWRELIAAKAVSGKQVHDARLVAVMLTYGITHILTFNDQDFVRYQSLPVSLGQGIGVVHPQTIS